MRKCVEQLRYFAKWPRVKQMVLLRMGLPIPESAARCAASAQVGK